ncbi:metal-dependent hydrolase [Thauera linaloolentis]|uniref:Membrane-bound metal-dependent hydrolase n=1 Tax=Thauera linaloolentis (strain DSM 12138 / JCM 21573 / CCUG 41526 / CIP 105981 / IAM 15112 / NBRC 102519 / 47Lol) TaxID=1123367 RepID=N6Y789_THAL4|nr:metal-dependent hydrolase [Thauera linaloolentis]ENO87420.1 membrane-bound metal-dependent hydrolase [Thauera linaloolentis 47Lol = DSM 12138]MCM8565070.1 metal-dependent hydrolase [Thauera linaloolentis]
MDTLTHALSGALVGRLLAGRRTGSAAGAAAVSRPSPPVWQMVAAGTAAAIFPDLDFILGWVSELTYLRGHRGVTHSLLLLPLWGLLIAWLLSRFWRRGGRAGPDWRSLYAVVCAGILIHILGDLITQFGTMILAPFSERRFGWGTSFIIDLPLTGIILSGLLGSALWRRSRVPSALALVLLAGWIGVQAVGRGEAVDAARAYAKRQGIRAELIDAAPRPASPFNWTAIVFDGERYHYAHINTRRSAPLAATADDNFIRRLSAPYLPVAQAQWEVRERFGGNGARELAEKVWRAEDFAFYRWFAMFPVLDHAGNGPSGQACANFVDLRFITPGRDETPFRYGLCSREGGWRLFERQPDGIRWVVD